MHRPCRRPYQNYRFSRLDAAPLERCKATNAKLKNQAGRWRLFSALYI
jgi:hypothetical protein